MVIGLINNITVQSAREFAIKAHGIQKYGGRPYVYHLDQVVEILTRYNYDYVTRIIGYLHDVIEDTKLTTKDIIKNFDRFIGECVYLLSDDMSIPNRKQRKDKFYSVMRDVDKNHEVVLIVKAADRLANLSNCSDSDLLNMYRREHKNFKNAVYRPGLCDGIWDEIDKIIYPKSKKFYMKADITFEADNIEDAFEKLRNHFDLLLRDKESEFVQHGGLEIAPIEAREDKMPEAHDDFYRETVPIGYYK